MLLTVVFFEKWWWYRAGSFVTEDFVSLMWLFFLRACLVVGVRLGNGNGWLPFQPFGWEESCSYSYSKEEWECLNSPKSNPYSPPIFKSLCSDFGYEPNMPLIHSNFEFNFDSGCKLNMPKWPACYKEKNYTLVDSHAGWRISWLSAIVRYERIR